MHVFHGRRQLHGKSQPWNRELGTYLRGKGTQPPGIIHRAGPGQALLTMGRADEKRTHRTGLNQNVTGPGWASKYWPMQTSTTYINNYSYFQTCY